MKIFYISDLHIGHQNVLTLDSRPFENLEEMEDAIRNNWNSVVSKEDLVMILGDCLWIYSDKAFEYIKSLNGRKRLIRGNHDRGKSTKYKQLFEVILDYEKIKDGDRTVICSHFPMIAYDGSYNGRNYHAYGHVHKTKEHDFIQNIINRNRCDEFPMNMYNVGCMLPYMNYTPQTLDEIIEANK